MHTLPTTSLLIAALAVSAPGGLAAQQATEAAPDSALAAWLVAEGLAPDSIEVVDARRAQDVEALILRVPISRHRFEYWTLARPASKPASLRRMGVLDDRWGIPSIEAIVEGDIYVRKHGNYGAPLVDRYGPSGNGSGSEQEFRPPRPGPVAVLGDSAYAAWRLGSGGQLALAVSLTDGDALTYHFRVEEPIEAIRRRGDTVAFVTSQRAIVRHPDGGWGGYRLRAPVDQISGARVLHPSLPQFRVVPGGLAELRLGDTLFIPLEFPDFEHFRRARPEHLPDAGPGDVHIEVDIGPVTDDGERVWFGLTFYDGEGHDGVGGIGWLNPSTREAKLVYPPEMADFSVSAIAVDRGDLLLGLAIRGEGAIHDAGLARYDPANRTFQRVFESGYIRAITVRENRIFVTSDRGLIEVDPDGNVRRWQVLPPPGPGRPPPLSFSREMRGG